MSIESVTTHDFETLQRLVEHESAIVVHDDKRSLVEMRLTPLAAECGFDNVQALLSAVSDHCPTTLKKSIVEALTTHETSFFREPALFEAMRKEILPTLIDSRAATRNLRIWSAACSSGQEPYSMAILLLEHFPEIASTWHVDIVASDISESVLAQAMEGRYRKHEVNRGLQAHMLLKYFEQDDDAWRVKPALQRMVSWRQINLSAPLPTLGNFDIVLLRNVLIYFSVDSKQQVVDRIHKALAGDGYFCLGGSESLMQVETPMHRELIGKTAVYRN